MESSAARNAIFDVIISRVAARLVLLVPCLGWPGLNAVFVFLLSRLAGLFFEEFMTNFKCDLVDKHTAAYRAAYDIDMERLRKAEMDQRGLEDATEKFKKTLRDLIVIRSP